MFVPRNIAFALSLGVFSVSADPSVDENSAAQEAAETPASQETWRGKPDPVFPEQAPCGPRTLLVAHSDSGDRYVFCADGDNIGVLETLADGDESRSLIGHVADAVDLLAELVPERTHVPDDVLAAVAGGKGEPRLTRMVPFVVGTPRLRPIGHSAAKLACAAPTRPFDPWVAFFNDSTYCGLVHTQFNTSNNSGYLQVTASLQYDAGGNEGSHQHAGPHEDFGGGTLYYYADEDEDGGARYGYSRVRACDGNVRLRSWKRPAPNTGSWDLIIDATVMEGATAGYYMWGNGPHSLWMGYDADDMRFRVDTIGTASFGALVYYAKYAWGPSCAMKF